MSWQPHGPSQSERSQSSSFAVKSGDGQGSKSNQKFPLYIVNIPLDINEEKLSEIFNEAGNVIHSKCLPPREGRNSCVGFITYSTEEEAEKAISLFNNVQMNNLTLKVDYTKSFKEGRTQKQDYAKSPFSSGNQTHGSQNSTRYSSNIQQNSSSQYPQELQSSNIHSIGRGIHHAYDSGNQLSSIGRGIHPESQQSVVNGFMAGNVGEGSSQPGMQPHSMNPEVPETTGMQGDSGLGQYNYQSNMDQDMQSSYYNGTQIPQSSMPNNLFIGGSDYHDAPQNTSTSSHEQSPYGGDVWEPPQGNSSFGGYNYQANSQSEMQSYSIDPQYQQPHSVQGDQLAVGSQVEMNGVVNGFGNMQLTSPAEPSASQSFGSNLHQVSSRLPRAQIGSGSVEKTCHNCGEAGHFSRECPNRFGGGGGQGGGCHRCGEQGHFARECPNSSGGVRGGNCHQCDQPGHFSRECPNNSGGGGQGGGCHRCGEQGHFARECPNSSGGDRGSNCHQCGQPGHFSRECPNNSGGGGQGGGCHRCGEHGHFARECPNNAQEGSCPRPPQKVDYVPPPIPDDVDLLFKAAVHKGINFDRFDNIPVEVTGNNPPPPINTFDELLLPDTLKSNLGRAEFTKPTPVQKHGIPIILNGRDIMACAQTGSGKTVAFLLPVMAGMVNSRLPEASYLGGDAPSPAALCVAPTRELAYQIYTEALKFSSGTYLRPVVCYGGVSVQHQLYNLERGCHILIGTPGRLIDFVGRNKVSFTNVRYLILDEADRMLDMGFENDVRKIVNQFGMPEKTQRQTLMFSATFPDEIQKLARDFLNDYLFLAVGSVGGSNLDIKQEVIDLQGDQKRSTLMAILGQSGTDKTLVFVERKRNADFLASWLSQNQYPATSISGDRTQKEREDALRDFRNGRAPVLIATSVAARGLDIPDVKHVINYDLPQQIEEYVHRIGRTGRIGNQGKATAFFERGKDDKLARSLVKVLSDALQDVPSWIEEVAERALGTSYGPSGGKFASRDTRQFGRGGSTGSESNSRTTPSTNISFANQPPPQLSNNVQNGDDEEEWD